MIQKKENGEILYTYLDEHFEPRENLSPYALMDKWRVVPIGTAEYSTNMLASLGGHPEDVTLSPALEGWYKKVTKSTLREIKSVKQSIQHYEDEILNYFINRDTNASAESLNSKMKAFRSCLKGIRDIPFFFYRCVTVFG